MTEQNLSSGFCTLGRQLQSEMRTHAQAIQDAQTRIAARHRAEDTMDRQVPRALHEDLSTANNRRALSQLQWTRHLAKCDTCKAVGAQPASQQQVA